MKISHFLAFLFSFLFLSCSTSKSTNYLVGTYTDNSTEGINYINFNSKTKKIKLNSVIADVKDPSFVIANKSKTIVIAVEHTESEKGGKVVSYSYDKSSKLFQKLNSFFTLGNNPCSVTFSPKEDYVLVGNYSGGNLSVFPIDKNGFLSDAVQSIQYEGKSSNSQRQEKPHVHCIVLHPNQSKIFVADLGTDSIEIIPFDENTQPFLNEEHALSYKVASGSGPRHLVFNSSGTILYATFELTNEIGVFEYKENNLKQIQTIALTAPTINGSAAELRLSNDEKFLYASVRGNDNAIIVMNTNDGKKLEVIQTIKTAKTPRNFILTKEQDNILVASQFSNLISVFERDIKTGLLKPTTNELSINKPVYFFPF